MQLVTRALVVVMLLVAMAACGGDDGGSVRDLAGSGSGSGAGSASASASGSGSGSASASGTAETACSPVGTELEAEATETVAIEASDYAYVPSSIEVNEGVVTFAVANTGAVNHELAFLPGGGEVPFVDGEPDEAALESAGAFELEGFSPGQTCNATYDLAPGTYTLFCIIVGEDGETHYEKGMEGTLTVT
jgi:plastocyanin